VRAIQVRAHGGPDQLALVDLAPPEPGPTEVLVRVRAAGVNPVDWKTRRGAGVAAVLGPPPWILGWDLAGTVEAVGLGVTRFAPGDEVFGMPRFPAAAGAYAELVSAPSRQLARRPAALSHTQAAGLPLAGLTAWQALVDLAGLRAGQRVLIHAAAGGVGHLAVQIARSRGARVIATASAPKHALLAALGADELIDHRSTAFEDACDPVDVVLDMGGLYGARSLRVLQPDGLLITDPSSAAGHGGPPGPRVAALLVEPDGHGLEGLAALADAGELTVHVAREADLADAAALHAEGEQGRTTGKLVLTT
jgi:NADPH:quinone reductase-like Zn-dependent oxidoreductase